jgi:RES domain-containing protein
MWDELVLASEGTMPPGENPRWVCSLDVDLRVLDLRDAATLRALRTSVAALTRPWSAERPNTATLRSVRAARSLGIDGLIVPSAARPGGWNLVVLPSAFDRVRLRSRRRKAPPSG